MKEMMKIVMTRDLGVIELINFVMKMIQLMLMLR